MTLSDLTRRRPVLGRARDVAAYAREAFAGFDMAFSVAPHRITRRIGGTVFEIVSDLPEQVALANQMLCGHATTEPSAAHLLITGREALNGMPAVPVWEHHGYNDYRLCNHFDDTRLRLHHYPPRNFWQFYDRQTGRGLQLMASPISYPDWDHGSPLRNLLRWHLVNDTQNFVHAGTLGLNGRGLMLAGPGGSGKSGTVLAGLLAGMQSVGDDYVLARLTETGGVRVLPVFTSLKNDPKGLQRLGISTESMGPKNWQGKHQFTFRDLVGKDPVTELEIGALCVPYITGARQTLITPMSRRDAYIALAKTGFEQMPGDRRYGLKLCSELIRRLPTFHLALGTDPTEIVDSLQRFLTVQSRPST